MSDAHKTRHTLLQRACDTKDAHAWEELVKDYRRFIVYILGKLGVAPDDLEDVTQQVLLALTKNLDTYDRNRARFRTWLSGVIRNSALDHFRKQKRQRGHLEKFKVEVGSTPQPDSDVSRLIEMEWSTYVANLAMERTAAVFQGQAITAFKLGLKGQSAAEIAKETGLRVSSVYTLHKRVKKRLYLEIRTVAAELEP